MSFDPEFLEEEINMAQQEQTAQLLSTQDTHHDTTYTPHAEADRNGEEVSGI